MIRWLAQHLPCTRYLELALVYDSHTSTVGEYRTYPLGNVCGTNEPGIHKFQRAQMEPPAVALSAAVPMLNGTTAADADDTIMYASVDLPVRSSPPPTLRPGSLGCGRADRCPASAPGNSMWATRCGRFRATGPGVCIRTALGLHGLQSTGTAPTAWMYGQSFTGMTERRRSGKLPGRAVTLDDGGLGGVLSGAGQSAPCWQFGPGGAVSGVRGCPYRSRIHDKFQRRSPGL